MSLLFDSTIKVSLVLLVAIGAVEMLNGRSAAVRHWALAVAVACAAVLPPFSLLLPTWHVPLAVVGRASEETTKAVVSATVVFRDEGELAPEPFEGPRSTATTRPKSFAWSVWLTRVWAAGVGVSLLMLLVGLARLAWLAACAEKVGQGRWVEIADEIGGAFGLRRKAILLKSSSSSTLGTWGVMRPKVLLPAAARNWSDDRVRIVLSHELAHVGRGDWVIQLMADVVRSLYWFNPLTWLVSAQLRRESEHACDDAVLNAGVPASEYASHLLDLARALHDERQAWMPAPAMARPSSLAGRISVMLNSSVNRTPLTRTARLAAVVALLAFTISIAGFGAQRFFTFSGSVVDSTNRFIPGATFVVTNATSKAKHEVKSDPTGYFEFVGLPPGEYALEVRKPGFSTYKDTVVVVGRDLDRVVELRVGSLEETVTVVGSSSAASGREGARRQELAPERIDELKRRAEEKCGDPVGTVGGSIIPPVKLVSVNPQYPENLRTAGAGGVVTADVVIGVDGHVRDVLNVKSPHLELEAAAVEAVRQWQFSQTLLNCTPTEVPMTVTIRFAVQP